MKIFAPASSPLGALPFFGAYALLILAATGPMPGSYIGALFGVAGMSVGLATVAWSRKSELDIGFWSSCWHVARMWRLWIFFLALFASILTGLLSGAEGPLFAVVTAGITASLFLVAALPLLRDQGVEREVLLKSTALAFFVTMVFVIGAAGVEVFTNSPRLSMWVVWSVGMFTWAISTPVIARRYTR